ncbi:MAG TPA: hypothetical protein VK013_12035 [Myxococcaceae bacterium]|nr:hypothetical protein [Myxococcaceae bacterium]
MAVHSFHLAKPGFFRTMAALLNPPTRASTAGLRHAECMFPMRLGAAILSPGRWQPRSMAMFAEWESEAAIEAFLSDTSLGRVLATGWHVRLRFLRRWGQLAALEGLPEREGDTAPDAPVVAVTLARLALPQVPRFLHWGKPVERFVRDHPGATLAMAATRPLRTISTFTIWRSAREMSEMVHGRQEGGGANRHAAAMVEHRRKDFHLEFTTLRFACISEHGAWDGRSSFVPVEREVHLPQGPLTASAR